MKNLAFLLMLLPLSLMAQDDIVLCHNPATESFALFATNQDFNATHKEPLPYVHKSEDGKIVTFPTPDGQTASAFALKSKAPSQNYLFVIHEWWGLNDQIKRQAEKMFNDIEDLNVLALDLYDGRVTASREEAGQFMRQVKTERAQAIIKGALAYAGKNARIATVGWCFGGGWSLQASLLASEEGKAAGCIIYYGMPEKSVDRLKDLNCDVLGIFATQDQWITPQVVENFEKNMDQAGKKLEIRNYEAKHAFANPSNPQHDEVATENAYQHTLKFLKNRLQ